MGDLVVVQEDRQTGGMGLQIVQSSSLIMEIDEARPACGAEVMEPALRFPPGAVSSKCR
jgi:hypothetical protein